MTPPIIFAIRKKYIRIFRKAHATTKERAINPKAHGIRTGFFSALAQWADLFGLRLAGYSSQANFLLSLGFSGYLRRLEQAAKAAQDDLEHLRMIQTFFLEMGTKLKVMILQKGFKNPLLTGAQFMDSRINASRIRV